MAKLLGHAAGWDHRRWNERPLPHGIDLGYFNVAPPDQQLGELHDDTRIVLENLHPEYARLTTRLRWAPPRAVVERNGVVQELPLRCDTLSIDTDRGVCNLVWRGQVSLRRPDEAGRVVILAETPGEEELRTVRVAQVEPRREAEGATAPRPEPGTVRLSAIPVAAASALPFQAAVPAMGVFAGGTERGEPAPRQEPETARLSAIPVAAALPFQARSPWAGVPAAGVSTGGTERREDEDRSGTVRLDDLRAVGPVLPFARPATPLDGGMPGAAPAWATVPSPATAIAVEPKVAAPAQHPAFDSVPERAPVSPAPSASPAIGPARSARSEPAPPPLADPRALGPPVPVFDGLGPQEETSIAGGQDHSLDGSHFQAAIADQRIGHPRGEELRPPMPALPLQIVGLWPAACTAVVEERRVTVLVEAAFEVVPGQPARLVQARSPGARCTPSSKGAGRTHAGHPEAARIEAGLPEVRARAIRYVTAATGEMVENPIELHADTLSVEEHRCSLVWRGELVLGQAEDLERMHVLAGVETSEYRITWPTLAREPVPTPEPSDDEAEPEPETGLRAVVVARVRAGEPLHDLPLAGADLSRLDFSGASLVRLDLRGARLSRCTFARARLAGARLAEADLTGAALGSADLTGADLSRTVLAGARFDAATLSETNLSSAQGPGASFEGASGRGASFAHGVWDRATFHGADLPAANFAGASLAGTRFQGASLFDLCLDDAHGAGARFDGARIPRAHAHGAALRESSFREVDATSSSWQEATLEKSVFDGACLQGANLTRAACAGASFAGADAGAIKMQHLRGDGADLRGANLVGADFRHAHLHDAIFDEANLCGASAMKADLSRGSFSRADLSQAILRSAKLKGARLSHARLDGTSFLDADLEGANVHGASIQSAKTGGANLKGLVDVDPDDKGPSS
jgi:uncharacterized protein YjbI with pentapeptide repeats